MVSAAPAFANDSVAELGTGGLILSRSDAVTIGMYAKNAINKKLETCRLVAHQRDTVVRSALVLQPHHQRAPPHCTARAIVTTRKMTITATDTSTGISTVPTYVDR